MANCGLCGGYALAGPVCAMCANTISGNGQTITVNGDSVRLANVFAITNDDARDKVWEAILEKFTASLKSAAGAGVRKYSLPGTLSSTVFSKSQTSFFETVTYGQDGGAEAIWNGRTAFHRTKPGSGSFTVVYQRGPGGDAIVIGTGNHVGSTNNVYSISFDDGTTKRCSRN